MFAVVGVPTAAFDRQIPQKNRMIHPYFVNVSLSVGHFILGFF